MENKIKLETATTFHLPKDEQTKLYTYLALAQYCYLRKPNYNEGILLKYLYKDIRKFLYETQSLCEQQPNNHTLNRIHTFFDNHHKHLKMIIEDTNKAKEST